MPYLGRYSPTNLYNGASLVQSFQICSLWRLTFFFTQSVSSVRSACPYHHNLFCCVSILYHLFLVILSTLYLEIKTMVVTAEGIIKTLIQTEITKLKLDRMCWFSDQRRMVEAPPRTAAEKHAARGPRPRGRLPDKMLHFIVFVPVTLTFNLDIWSLARFLYNAANCRVSSSYV